jgi:hypothetical protein
MTHTDAIKHVPGNKPGTWDCAQSPSSIKPLYASFTLV